MCNANRGGPAQGVAVVVYKTRCAHSCVLKAFEPAREMQRPSAGPALLPLSTAAPPWALASLDYFRPPNCQG
jgi:hypothetical protein